MNGCGIVVDDVVDSRFGGKGGCGCDGCVFDVNEGPDGEAFSDEGKLLGASLVGCASVGVVPGVGAVEEAVAYDGILLAAV